jgi:alpha-methylacyl-CoA racemase
MAGHDINYLATSGVLFMLGQAGKPPSPPGNLLADFAGGGAMCFMGIPLALLSRSATSKGQAVESNMVDGSAYIATMPRLSLKTRIWNQERGKNLLDGGCPYYTCYMTKDRQYMAV